MTDIDKILQDVGGIARDEIAPAVDVSSRVMRSIATQPEPPRIDVLPVAFAGGAVAVAALVCLACLPTWQLMLEPWVGFFPE